MLARVHVPPAERRTTSGGRSNISAAVATAVLQECLIAACIQRARNARRRRGTLSCPVLPRALNGGVRCAEACGKGRLRYSLQGHQARGRSRSCGEEGRGGLWQSAGHVHAGALPSLLYIKTIGGASCLVYGCKPCLGALISSLQPHEPRLT